MKFEKLQLKPAAVITLKPFEDQRGMFKRLFDRKEITKIGLKKEVVQANYSFSKKTGTLRGLHLQTKPFTEGKFVTCLKGKIFDCLVDLRSGSPTFLKWHGEILSGNNHKMLYIPEGFAHGLETLTDDCLVLYFHTNYYRPSYEKRIRYNDPSIDISWPQKARVISTKDKQAPILANNFKGFKI